MVRITNHQGNGSENNNEILSHRYEIPSHSEGYYTQTKQNKITSVGEDVEKLEPVCTVGGKVNWFSLYGQQDGGSSKNLKKNYYESENEVTQSF